MDADCRRDDRVEHQFPAGRYRRGAGAVRHTGVREHDRGRKPALGVLRVKRHGEEDAAEGERDTTHTTIIARAIRIGPVPARVFVVEDDPDIADLVTRYLDRAGYATTKFAAGRDAIDAARAKPPDLMVLDVMLPQMDGLEVCRLLRANEKTAAIPIIMLTARAEESDRIVGLEIGADDYVPKPFSPNELVARVRAHLRRAQRTEGSAAHPIVYRGLTLDPERHTVELDGRALTLTAKEFLLLAYLLQHRGRVLSRDILLEQVWGYRYTGGTRTVDVHIRRLREKVPLLSEALVTVKQFGYKLLE